MRNTRITRKEKDPLGSMLLDYLQGDLSAGLKVESANFDMWTMDGAVMFRTCEELDELERKALSLCTGRILDAGAGSGCHSLCLQKRGLEVDALDISAGCVEVMKRRQVRNVIHEPLFSLRRKKYDTVLMLMNGLGICGSIDGCNLFLQFIKDILKDGGQVIADSTDLRMLPGHEENDRYFGETEFVMKYRESVSDPFEWLYIDFDTLQSLVKFNGLNCSCIMKEDGGRYLVRIY